MPPRFAYWTILIDNAPTAFRAREAQELLPTLAQLRRTNENVVMKWFSGGTLWDSPIDAQNARRRPPAKEKRGPEWRPGGQHRDPRARFAKNKKPKSEHRSWGATARGPRKPWSGKPGGPRKPSPQRDRNMRRPGPPRGPRAFKKKRDNEE